MEFEVGESLVEGVGSLHMNSHPVNVEFDACSTPGSTGHPPYHPSINQLKHDWSSSGSHATPTDQKMKTVYSSSGSKIVSKRSHKISHLVMDNEGDSNSLHSRKDIVHRNEQVVDETGQDNPIKQNLTSESDFAIQQPVEDAETCNPGGVGLLNSSLLPDKGPVEILNTPLPSKLGMGFCPSPQNSFYSATQYMEAKQSFTNTEVSESTSSIRKSVESGEVSNSWDFSENKKACMYRGSTGSDISDESSSSSFSSAMYKPHQGLDIRWEAIQAVRSRNNGAALELKDFRIFKRLGGGDIGSVHLAELIGTRTCFALKVMDKEALVSRKKLLRAQTEKEILQCLDHPFLPSLYNHFETEKLSFLVMEFCPGGDLHVLRQKQPGKFFPEHAARFYVAEVLLALEYLHMLGIIYRDLKPENVLVREDGHIMLSDFDLSLRCTFSPTLVKSSNATSEPKNSGYCIGPSCVIQPNCIQPTCFGPRFLNKLKKEKKPRQKTEMYHHHQVTPLPELIAEPTNARSMSFVGTHEYLAPEIIKGEGHGSAVDWWMFGIFLYELLFGRTPFKGSGNRATLFNVVGQPLRFPEIPSVSFAARDLIRGLLVKEPQHRLAYRRGATEIKQHPFFQSVNWALIRCASPPDVPPPFVMHDVGSGKVQGGDVKAESGNYYEIDFF